MGGFDNPVERHRDEGVIVSRLEKERKEKEEFSKALSDSTKTILTASILLFLKKLFDSYPIKSKEGEGQLSENLEAFKNLLEHLGSKDESNGPKYAQQLSELWHKLELDFNLLAYFERKNPKLGRKIKNLVDEINRYPSDKEHSFGYYLKENTGKEWLPLPYREILSLLHKEHQRKPHESHLFKWLLLIEDILKEGFNP